MGKWKTGCGPKSKNKNTRIESLLTELISVNNDIKVVLKEDNTDSKSIINLLNTIISNNGDSATTNSNNLLKVISKLESLGISNEEIKVKLDSQIKELKSINDKLSELIELINSDGDTIPIYISNSKKIDIHNEDLEKYFTVKLFSGGAIEDRRNTPHKDLLISGRVNIYVKPLYEVNKNTSHKLHWKIEQIDQGISSLANLSFDRNKSRISTDKFGEFNNVSTTASSVGAVLDKTFEIKDFNEEEPELPNIELTTKIDPGANYISPVILFNKSGLSTDKVSLKEFSFDIIEGKKTYGGSVTYFYDKNGLEVESKRIFRVSGKPIEEPPFWEEIKEKIQVKETVEFFRVIDGYPAPPFTNFKSLSIVSSKKGAIKVVSINGSTSSDLILKNGESLNLKGDKVSSTIFATYLGGNNSNAGNIILIK